MNKKEGGAKVSRHRIRICSSAIICATLGLAFMCPSAPFGAEHQANRHHSLIHRQPSVESGTALVSPPAAPPVRSLHRTLTKRPEQQTLTAPTTDSTQAPGSLVPPSSTSSTSSTRTGTDSRISLGGVGFPAPGTGPAAGMAAASTSLTATLLPPLGNPALVKPSSLSGLASAGSRGTFSSGPAGGRALERLSTQLPGLTQLLIPTVSLSSPHPSSDPSTTPASAPPLPAAGSGMATLTWTMNNEPDLGGYKIYVGTAPGLYNYAGSPIIIGRTGNYTVTGLPTGQTYYFAISAFNYSGGESGLSAEVSKSIY